MDNMHNDLQIVADKYSDMLIQSQYQSKGLKL